MLITSERFVQLAAVRRVYRIRVSDGEPVTDGDNVDRRNGGLTDDVALGAGDPSLSPSGARIAYFKSVLPVLRSPQEVSTMRADGTDKRRVPAEGLVAVHPGWGARSTRTGTRSPTTWRAARSAPRGWSRRACCGPEGPRRWCWTLPARGPAGRRWTG